MLCLALFSACSSNEQVIPQNPQDENSTIVDLGNVKFDISELPFGEDTEDKTRTAEQPLMADTVVLSKSVEAEVTLERERTPVTRGVKHGLSDGAYRLVVYQANVFKTQVGFTIAGGKITYLEKLILNDGNYDFYCCKETGRSPGSGITTAYFSSLNGTMPSQQQPAVRTGHGRQAEPIITQTRPTTALRATSVKFILLSTGPTLIAKR